MGRRTPIVEPPLHGARVARPTGVGELQLLDGEIRGVGPRFLQRFEQIHRRDVPRFIGFHTGQSSPRAYRDYRDPKSARCNVFSPR